jgi:hypothetical protein
MTCPGYPGKKDNYPMVERKRGYLTPPGVNIIGVELGEVREISCGIIYQAHVKIGVIVGVLYLIVNKYLIVGLIDAEKQGHTEKYNEQQYYK